MPGFFAWSIPKLRWWRTYIIQSDHVTMNCALVIDWLTTLEDQQNDIADNLLETVFQVAKGKTIHLHQDIMKNNHIQVKTKFKLYRESNSPPQLTSSGVSLTNGFPRMFAGSPHVAAVSVFGVFLSNLASHRMSHVQFRGLESSRL